MRNNTLPGLHVNLSGNKIINNQQRCSWYKTVNRSSEILIGWGAKAYVAEQQERGSK